MSIPMHVAIVGGDPHYLLNFRGALMRDLRYRGHSVTALAGGAAPDVRQALAQLNVQYESFPLDRQGIRPSTEARTVLHLRRTLLRLRPDVVLAYTPKVIVYATAAARLSRVERVCALVTGLGTAFTDTSRERRRVNLVVQALMAIALRGVDLAVFQNDDDRAELLRRRVLSGRTRTARVNGSGIDTAHFAYTPPPTGSDTVFLLVARLQREKGVYEYAEAARLLKERGVPARCVLVGPIDAHPAAIDPRDLERWQDEGTIEWVGPKKDVRPLLADCNVFVLPSYREGTPRSSLEALAVGRPVITTDVPGCRETVQANVNGLLVPARDGRALADAMQELAGRPDLRRSMGEASRRLAERKFDVNLVNAHMLALLEGLCGPRLAPERAVDEEVTRQ